jgi:GT2 family glycosyltransferase
MKRRSVNISILNYNGRHLLEKYLPSIVKASENSRHDCRVSVIDNRSSDGSVVFLKSRYPAVELYEAPQNRVLCSFNDYLSAVEDEIVIFMNNDIRVDPYFVDPLIGYFNDEDVLFVAPKEFGMDGSYQGNLNRLVFRFGLLSTEVKKEDFDRPQYDISVHGGAFDRKKFLQLGGYDDLYLPGIVEDLDLCYRGWKRGWKGVYEPASFYYHEQGASFNAEYGSRRKAVLAHRNTFLFFWKNVDSARMLFVHACFTPFLLLANLVRGRTELVEGFIQALSMMGKAAARRGPASRQALITDEEVMARSRARYQTITEPPQTRSCSPTT